MKNRTKKTLRYLLKPQAVILGVTTFHLCWISWRESKIDWAALNYHGIHENPDRALLLLVASLGLLLNRWWGWLIAMILSGRVIYVLAFEALLSVSYAHDVPMFSRFALRNWLGPMFQYRPHHITQIALAGVIFIYAAALLLNRASRSKAPTGI